MGRGVSSRVLVVQIDTTGHGDATNAAAGCSTRTADASRSGAIAASAVDSQRDGVERVEGRVAVPFEPCHVGEIGQVGGGFETFEEGREVRAVLGDDR